MSESISEPLTEAQALLKTRRAKGDPRGAVVNIDRLPPHSIEAEQGVLGCCLLDPNTCLDECATFLGHIGKMGFYDLRHQTIYDFLTTMRNKQIAIDLITVQQVLKDGQMLEQIGGIAYLSELQDAVPSAANLTYYLGYVKEKYILRRYISVCSGTVGKIYDYKGDVEKLCDEVEKEILAVNADTLVEVPPSKGQFLAAALSGIEASWSNGGAPTGLATGFADLDAYTRGLHPGNMIVIAARPSMGKTSLAMNIAEHVAVNSNEPVGIFSLEMTGEELITRMLASVGKVNVQKVMDGHFNEGAAQKLQAASHKINAAPLFIDDTGDLSIMQLRARARRMHQQHGIKLFVIDYLQLLNADVGRDANREREVSKISAGIKALAKELKVPVIVLSQFNRELEKENRKPRLSDLRESGSIEQDADVVGLLYKPKNAKGQEDEPATQEEQDAGELVKLLIAKQRNGPRNVVVNLTFLKGFTRFESCSQFADQDLPNHNDPYADN